MTGCRRLLFVYNADSGPFNALFDIGHKILSPETYACQLCRLTHGYLRERAAWRDFRQDLSAGCEFLHRDQFRGRWPGNREPLPAVFRLDSGQPVVGLTAERIAACGSPAELMDLVRALAGSGGPTESVSEIPNPR